MKKITLLFMALLLGVGGVKADETVSVWTGSVTLKPWESESPEVTLGLSWGNEYQQKLANAYMQDVIKITYTMTESQSEYEIRFADPSGWNDMVGTTTNPTYSSGEQTYSYTINNVGNLSIIRERGIVVRGNHVTVTKVELVKTDSRYDAEAVVIGSDGIATWSSSKHLSLNETGVTVYYASAANDGIVTLTPVTESGKENSLWYYQGYIVKGEAGTYEARVVDQSSVSWPDGNLLVATSDGTAKVFKSYYTDYSYTDGDFWYSDEADKTAKSNLIKDKYRYIFAKKGDETPGFYKLGTEYSRTKDATTVYYHELGAHKAYLETSTDITPGAGARVALVFSDEAETTGISASLGEKVEKASEHIYNLRGMRVTQPQKGLYIKNGKKMIIR